MKVIKRDIPYIGGEKPIIVNISDTHLGALSCNEQRLKQDIQWIRDTPNAYCILAGDIVDGHDRKHPYFDERTHAEWLRGENDTLFAMVDKAREFFMPIRDKILGYVSGNHEENQESHNKTDLYRMVAMAVLGDDYVSKMLGHRGCISVSFRRQHESGSKGSTWRQNYYVTHGSGGAKKQSSVLNKIIEYMHQSDADITVCGHFHKGQSHYDKSIGFNALGNIYERTRLGIANLSYTHTTINAPKGYTPISTYADKKDYSLGFIGCSAVVFDPAHKQFDDYIMRDRPISDVFGVIE